MVFRGSHNKCHELTKEKLAEKRKGSGYTLTKTNKKETKPVVACTEKTQEAPETKYDKKQESDEKQSSNTNSRASKRHWIDKIDDQVIEEYSNSVIEKINMSPDNESEFWFDAIKRYRESSDKRLAFALKNLPLPAAFRECFIALRAIISVKKKSDEKTDNEYKFLYKLGAVLSMYIPYSEKKEQPGYNVMVKIPGGMLLKLPTPYDLFGYEKMGFSKTDCKAFVSLWGEPKNHTTMNEFYHEIWEKYENKLRKL